MAKVKYRFNPNNLSFEKDKNTKLIKILIGIGVPSFFVVLAFMFYFIMFNYIDSPKEIALKREIEFLKTQNSNVNDKIKMLTNIVDNLEMRDKNIYREIFEAEPIPDDVREGGYGGIERYKDIKGFKSSNIMIDRHKKIDRLSKRIYILSKSFEEIKNLAKNKENMLVSIPAIQPISNKKLRRISSGFGYRIDPILKIKKMHSGLDFTARKGTKIYATGNGLVEKAEWSGGFGKAVIINHGYNYKTVYAHMSKFNVRAGQRVKRGDVIGYVGNTGRSTSSHLHYEVWKNKKPVNPINFIAKNISSKGYIDALYIANQVNQSLD